MAASFFLLASFLWMTSSRTSVPRRPLPFPKTWPAGKTLILYVAAWALHVKEVLMFRFPGVIAVHCFSFHSPALTTSTRFSRNAQVRFGGKGWAVNCTVWNCWWNFLLLLLGMRLTLLLMSSCEIFSAGATSAAMSASFLTKPRLQLPSFAAIWAMTFLHTIRSPDLLFGW